MSAGNKPYIRVTEILLESDTIADGDYDFLAKPFGSRVNIIDYFAFVDSSGDPIEATGGTVTITISSGYGVFQTINDGSFNATSARTASRTKPNGYGRGETVRVSLSGIAGAGVAGFRSMLSQSN
jgi:hypothetical protein